MRTRLKVAEDMVKRYVGGKKHIEDVKSQVKKFEDVVKNKESRLSGSAKQIKADTDFIKTPAQAQLLVSKEPSCALKDKLDLEEMLREEVEELDEVKTIQGSLSC